jgi:hypothetical protein
MHRAMIRAGVAACLAAVAGCSSTSSAVEGTGSTLRNFLMYGGPTVPPPRADAEFVAPCPSVDVFEGGAALRVSGGQITLGQLARECVVNQDGSITVKVGIEGRGLLGPGGAAGRFAAPVRVLIKVGDKVVASRARTVPVAIPAGEAQGFFNIVEEGIVVPKQYAHDYEIEVGLGSGGGASAEKPKRRAAR